MASSPQVILITGCSTGIGRALAVESLAKGLQVIATARKLETIENLKDSGAEIRALDVTWPVERLKDFASEAWQIHGRIDYLINNAAYLYAAPMEESPHEEIVSVFQTNFFGLVNLVNAFLPFLRQQKFGVIVNISSQVGTIPLGSVGAYGASKAAVDLASDVYDVELRDHNIRCITIEPGMFRTAVASPTNFRTPLLSQSYVGTGAYKPFVDFVKWYAGNSGKEPGDPKKAAQHIIRVVTEPDRSKIPSRLVLGKDAYQGMLAVEKKRLELMEQWNDVSASCDFDE